MRRINKRLSYRRQNARKHMHLILQAHVWRVCRMSISGSLLTWLQEAWLSQMLRVIEYIAKSLKVTQGHSKWYPWVWFCKWSLLIFHCNYVSISYIYIYAISFVICILYNKWMNESLWYSAPSNGVTMKFGSEVIQDYWKWHHRQRSSAALL